MLSVTNIGLGAIANAQEGGFLINLSDFRVSEYDVSGLAPVDFITTEDMRGTPVFSAAVTTIEVVDTSAVRLTFTIPADVPTTGVWNLREVGVYLESGALFAYGPLEPAYEKSSEFSIKVHVLVVAHRLADAINVVVSSNNSLPASPYIKSLVPPANTYQNAVIVLDESVNDFADASTAGLALKSGPGSAQWAFVGYNRIYAGEIDALIDSNEFVLNPDRGGFWLNDGEVVIAQIISGLGSGFSRKLVFDKESSTFSVTDKEWAQMSTTSQVAIWRNLKNQLPTRTSDMEEFLVLGVGENTWTSTRSSSTPTKYISHFAQGTLNSLGKFASAVLTNAESLTTYAFIGGRCLPPGTFDVSSGQIHVPGKAGQNIEIYTFIKEQVAVGGMLVKFEVSYPTDGVTTRYYLPIVPDSGDWVEVYVNDLYVGVSGYGFEPTSIVFASPPAIGTLRISSFATYEDNGASTTVNRYFYQALEGATLTFAVDSELFEQNRALIYVEGTYYGEPDFKIGEGSITLLKTPTYVNGAATVDISVFLSVSNTSVGTQSGTDTGPVWVDPAGRLGPPNKLVPKVNSYISDGSRLEYPVYSVPRKENIVMIAGGAYQDARNYTFTQGARAAAYDIITLSTPIPFGVPIDFICFTDVLDAGTATACEVFNFVTQADKLSYTVNPVANVEAVFVVIGGVYHHQGSFQISNGVTLNLQSVIPNQEAEVWYFKTAPHDGWRTEMHVEYDYVNSINKYLLTKKVQREENTLTFLSSVYQNKNKYSIVEADYMQHVAYDTPLAANMYDLPVATVYFVSGPPLTRLMLREDSETYMPRHGPYVDWPNLSYRLRNMLACPMTKLLSLLTGSMEADFNNGSSSDKDLAYKYGLQPVTKSLTMSVLPTAAYAGTGPGAMLGAKMQFNVYKYLEIFLKQELGSATFTIHTYEQGVKYFIDNIQLGQMTYDAVARADIPMITFSTGIFINYPNALTGVTYQGIPLLTNFFDMAWSRDNVVLPAGFALGNTSIRTQSVSVTEDDSLQLRTFTHTIVNGFDGQTYTVKWARTYTVANQNIEYMTLVDGGGAPGYVQYFARLHAQWKYLDADIVTCMYYNKVSMEASWWTYGATADAQWCSWVVTVKAGSVGGNYPAVAAYTAGLAFGVVVDNYDATTGNCDLMIRMTSGTIGYSYFPADMLIKNIQIPVSYTIYPAISVSPDGKVSPMISNEDLFKSCCWTDFTPSTVLDCGVAPTPSIPTVSTMITTNTKPIIKGTYPNTFAIGLSVTVGNQTFVKGVSSALSTIDNMWELNLSTTAVTLTPGFYDVSVSVDVGGDTPLIDASVNEIFVQASSDVTAPTAPTVNIATFNTLKPVITGTFPSTDVAGGFSVTINGWSYLLNSKSVMDVLDTFNTRSVAVAPLTSSGNNWSLDMNKDSVNSLAYQTYSVIARVTDAAGNSATDTTSDEVTLTRASFIFDHTIAVNTKNFVVRTAAIAAGWDGVAPLVATVTINPGIIVGSTSTSTYAFKVGSLSANSTAQLINNGKILGVGGSGGVGGAAGINAVAGAAGGNGGPALLVDSVLTVTNNGTIGGGGGGGGGGGSTANGADGPAGGGGGGGGAGDTGGAGGSGTMYGAGGYQNNTSSPSGSIGTDTTPGTGGLNVGNYMNMRGGNGGTGGYPGQSGNSGTNSSNNGDFNSVSPGTGGSPGVAVNGNANITWIVAGTVLGSVI